MVESPGKEIVEGKRLTEYVKPPLPKVKRLSDEWAVLRFLKRWTPQDIRKAIDDDVDLADLMLDNWAKTGFLRLIAKRNRKKVGDNLSPGNVLYWFSVRRPDLYPEIVWGGIGEPWLIRNFDKVRTILFNQ